MIITTTSSLENAKIVKYLGLVTGEVILGANVFKDFLGGIRDIVGGRSGAYEDTLQQARTTATTEMINQAKKLGANAIIGVDLDYETVGQNSSMLMVNVSGTAVIVE